MRSISDAAYITFVDGSGSESSIVLDDGTIIDPVDSETGLDCTDDRLLFLTDFSIVNYFVSINSNYVVLTPTIMQYKPGCPIDCYLDESQSGGIINNSVFNVSPTDGRISIKQTDTSQVGDISLDLICVSTLSADFARVTIDNFIVSFQAPSDNCESDILDFATPIQQNIDYTVASPANVLLLNPGLI